MKGTCLLQGGVETSGLGEAGERERVSGELEAGEQEPGGPGAGAVSPRGPEVIGRVPGVCGTREQGPSGPGARVVTPRGRGARAEALLGPEVPVAGG